ncbi:curli production assembly/transport protein CsgE [Belliella sp. R4-6]|uniref:Curli production assembly/transport component CsgE n=1 Tax=Belliella alkalica TaxID=1730871 RepID=A0ABS9VE42_9BACT|nr:curli production assembly/transport protein CsgE [Belliella alkalica]MCH7414658.1 curli production assembly/transport protein CsgE [Belliella alkalica]
MDSVNIEFKYSEIDTTKVTKEAPDSVKKLLEDIVNDELTKSQVSKKKSGFDLEIDGLVIDDTKTKSGRDFFDFFFRDWEAPANAKNFIIYVSEKPFRLNSTLIEIQINETLVYQSFLQPRLDVIEAMALESIGTTQMYLANYEALMLELGGSDVRGTGIY